MVLLLWIFVVAIASCAADTLAETKADLPDNATVSKYLLLFEQAPLSAEDLAARAPQLSSLPFDGVLFTIGASSQIQSNERIGVERLRRELEPLASADLGPLRHNFVLVYATPAGPITDYESVAANFADLAQAAAEVGVEGIFFDSEEYFGPTWRPDVICPGMGVPACQSAARATGRAVMAAMVDRDPDVRVMTSAGPWLSEPATHDHLAAMDYIDVASANPVFGYFAAGLFAGTAGNDATYIDGGGFYTQRSVHDLAVAYDWMRHGMAASSAVVPDDLRGQYEDRIQIAFGVYDFPEEYRGKVSDVTTWASDIRDALRVSDRYVWAYSERYDWTGNPDAPDKPAAPTEYLTATATARVAAEADSAAAGDERTR
jgi:hypothetical protein